MPILPFKLNRDRRHHIPRQRRKVTNWPAYDASLRQRGSQRGAGIRGMGALTPTPLGSGDADGAWASEIQHAVERVDGDRHLGRPALVRMRAHPPPVFHVLRMRNLDRLRPSPITCFHLFMVASARARLLYPDAFCHAMRPCSAMCWRWPSRCVGGLWQPFSHGACSQPISRLPLSGRGDPARGLAVSLLQPKPA